MGVSLLKKGVARKLITYLFSLRAAPGLNRFSQSGPCICHGVHGQKICMLTGANPHDRPYLHLIPLIYRTHGTQFYCLGRFHRFFYARGRGANSLFGIILNHMVKNHMVLCEKPFEIILLW